MAPFNQAYYSPYLNFGYKKTQLEDPRCFELTLFARLNDECIQHKIFNDYEVYTLLESMIKQLIVMKPVMLKDFDFLLLHTYKTYDF